MSHDILPGMLCIIVLGALGGAAITIYNEEPRAVLYLIHDCNGNAYRPSTIQRLPDGGVAFMYNGRRVEIHGSYTVREPKKMLP